MYKKDDLYYCSICKSAYINPLLADSCEKSHDSIIISLTRAELQSIVNFFVTQDIEVLEPTVFQKLQRALINAQKSKNMV